MLISLRQHNININHIINSKLKKCFSLFKNNIYNEDYMNEQIFDLYKVLNNGTLRIKIRLCCFCNYFIIVNLNQDHPITFKDIINVIDIYIDKNISHEKNNYCNFPSPISYEIIEALNYIERYNQLETILI